MGDWTPPAPAAAPGAVSVMTGDQVRLARQFAGKRDGSNRRENTITQMAERVGVGRPALYRAPEP